MKTLAQELKEENDRLMFKIRCNSIKGKTFNLEQVQQLANQREQELAELDRKNVL